MTLYTALGEIGTERGHGGRHPYVSFEGGRKLLDIPEMVIWATLKYRFLELAELERLYQQRVSSYDLGEVPPCTAYIDRMLQRGLIADGHGQRGHDALYDLLAELRIFPIVHNLVARLGTFTRLAARDRLPIGIAATALRTPRLTNHEKEVLALCAKVPLSTAEVICSIEEGLKGYVSEEEVVSALYSDEHTTYDNISGTARALPCEELCITTIANLYLRQLIMFERI